MVVAWRRAFCTATSTDRRRKESPILATHSDPTPGPISRFRGFFSNPSTPRLHLSTPKSNFRCTAPPEIKAPPQSPKLQCKTKLFHRSSAPSSPRSPSTFDRLRSSLLLTKSRCRICLQSVKAGRGTAIFTAECGHSFHFPCIATHVRKQGSLTCPACNCTWKEMHLLTSSPKPSLPQHIPVNGADLVAGDLASRNVKKCVMKIYNDDEPLCSPTSGARFNPIPESDETGEENDEFPGFFNVASDDRRTRHVEVDLLPETAVVSVGKTCETYAVVLRIKAPAAPVRRSPIDLVTVLNVGRSITVEKLHLIKRVMRMVVSSLTASDRLSIVAFSTTSRRLLPLRRMTTAGRRSARRIIDAVVALDGAASDAADAVKKAAKVLEDRREKNLTASILLLSDGHRSSPVVSSSRFSQLEIPLHSVNLSSGLNAPPEENVVKSITGLLSEAVKDLEIQLGFASGSAPAEISAVYLCGGKPAFIGFGSSWCPVGDFSSGERRELLIELRVPASLVGARRILTVRSSYKDPSTHQTMYDHVRPLLIPRSRALGSSTRDIQRLRCLFVTTRAVAESRRLAEREDLAGASHMLAAARALVLQSSSGSGEEFVRRLEAELTELRVSAAATRRRNDHERDAGAAEDGEALTPTSAWRAAERLAKVAVMKKSLNRVSDLHGFENARF